MDNLYDNIHAEVSLENATRTADANGTSVDLAAKDAQEALILISVGTMTDGNHEIVVEESDDDSSWSAVADTHLSGSEPTLDNTNGDEVLHIGYHGGARYLRVSVTVTGSPSTGGDYAALIVLGGLTDRPVTH